MNKSYFFFMMALGFLATLSNGRAENHGASGSSAPDSSRGVTIAIYSCTCSGDWSCSKDNSVKGSVISAPHAPFTSVSEKLARRDCIEYLNSQLEGLCNGFGELNLNSDPTCTNSQQPIPPGPTPPPTPKTKTSKKPDGTVVTWTLDASNPSLGEAWKDPTGMVWGNVARNKNGKILRAHHSDASEYCKCVGTKLPEETDFERIVEYLGSPPDTGGDGYVAGVLPAALAGEKCWGASRYYPHSGRRKRYFAQDLKTGHAYPSNEYESRAVLCVIDPKVGQATPGNNCLAKLEAQAPVLSTEETAAATASKNARQQCFKAAEARRQTCIDNCGSASRGTACQACNDTYSQESNRCFDL